MKARQVLQPLLSGCPQQASQRLSCTEAGSCPGMHTYCKITVAAPRGGGGGGGGGGAAIRRMRLRGDASFSEVACRSKLCEVIVTASLSTAIEAGGALLHAHFIMKPSCADLVHLSGIASPDELYWPSLMLNVTAFSVPSACYMSVGASS